jgi:hypothetical protein
MWWAFPFPSSLGETFIYDPLNEFYVASEIRVMEE